MGPKCHFSTQFPHHWGARAKYDVLKKEAKSRLRKHDLLLRGFVRKKTLLDKSATKTFGEFVTVSELLRKTFCIRDAPFVIQMCTRKRWISYNVN